MQERTILGDGGEFIHSPSLTIKNISPTVYETLLKNNKDLNGLINSSTSEVKALEAIVNELKPIIDDMLTSPSFAYKEKFARYVFSIKDLEFVKHIIKLVIQDTRFTSQIGYELLPKFLILAEIESEKEQEKKQTGKPDLVRGDGRNAAEVAIKILCVKLLLTDEGAQQIYGPTLYPKFRALFEILLWDIIKEYFIDVDEDGRLKSQPTEKVTNLHQEVIYGISKVAYNQLYSEAVDYLKDVAAHCNPSFQPLYPSGLTLPLTHYVKAVTKLTSASNKPQGNSKQIIPPVKLKNGETIHITPELIGDVGLFATMIAGANPIFRLWQIEIDKLISTGNKKNVINEIFTDSKALQQDLEKLFWDVDFYLLSCGVDESNKDKLKLELNAEHYNALKAFLDSNLEKSTEKDEVELANDLLKLLEKYKNNSLSREFKTLLDKAVDKFELTRIAAKIHIFLDSPEFINLMTILPEWKFSEQKAYRHKQIHQIMNAIFNKPSALDELPNPEFVKVLKDFLEKWGPGLKSVLQQNSLTKIFKFILKNGLFKGSIAKQMEKNFKLPMAISELSKILKALRDLPDEDLVVFFRSQAKDPQFDGKFNETTLDSALYDAKTAWVSDLRRNYMFEVCNNPLSLVKTSSVENAKSFLKQWNETLPAFHDLINCEKSKFKPKFNSLIKNTFFKNVLTRVLHGYEKYAPIQAYIATKLYYDKLSSNLKTILQFRSSVYIGHVTDLPSQTAARSIRDKDYFPPTLNGKEFTKERFVKEMQLLGLNFTCDLNGHSARYPQIYATFMSGLIDYDIVWDTAENALSGSGTKIISKKFTSPEVMRDIKYLLNIVRQEHSNVMKKQYLSFALHLAIDIENKDLIDFCLKGLSETNSAEVSSILITDIDASMHLIYALRQGRLEGLNNLLGWFVQNLSEGKISAEIGHDILDKIISEIKINDVDDNSTVYVNKTYKKLFNLAILAKNLCVNITFEESSKKESSGGSNPNYEEISAGKENKAQEIAYVRTDSFFRKNMFRVSLENYLSTETTEQEDLVRAINKSDEKQITSSIMTYIDKTNHEKFPLRKLALVLSLCDKNIITHLQDEVNKMDKVTINIFNSLIEKDSAEEQRSASLKS